VADEEKKAPRNADGSPPAGTQCHGAIDGVRRRGRDQPGAKLGRGTFSVRAPAVAPLDGWREGGQVGVPRFGLAHTTRSAWLPTQKLYAR
jgi:hypothetical protein